MARPAARTYGFKAQGWKKELEGLWALGAPAILFWNFNHFVVLEGVSTRGCWINDPAMGRRRVTWEVTAFPGMCARHTYSIEDRGDGRSAFSSWEQAMGPGFRLTRAFWVAHFRFVRDTSLEGAQRLEEIYVREGRIEL